MCAWVLAMPHVSGQRTICGVSFNLVGREMGLGLSVLAMHPNLLSLLPAFWLHCSTATHICENIENGPEFEYLSNLNVSSNDNILKFFKEAPI